MSFEIRQGDVLTVLPTLADCSFDACLTDPPYGLSFMGKAWDHGVPGAEVWREVLRVLKPGASLLAFGGTRTFHRLACALEDAGFEIRDTLMWIYGQGFPKSLDLSKALSRTPERQQYVKEKLLYYRQQRGYSQKALGELCQLKDPAKTIWDWEVGGHSPSNKHWLVIRQILGVTPEEEARFEREIIGEVECGKTSLFGGLQGRSLTEQPKRYALSGDVANLWGGYGTALKPAYEPIIWAMKPCAGTFAQNAMEHGVAGINVDAGRIGLNGERPSTGGGNRRDSLIYAQDSYTKSHVHPSNRTPLSGRWPANVLLDEQAAAMLDAQSGELTSGFMERGTPRNNRMGYSGAMPPNTAAQDTYADTGGASRFFYIAKADSDERCLKLFHSKRITHPTMKPLDLCRYLAKLLLPPEGRTRRILVPFSGSGSEIIGALRAGWDEAVGVELDPEYAELSRERIAMDAPLFQCADEQTSAGDLLRSGHEDQRGLKQSCGDWLAEESILRAEKSEAV